MKNYLAVISENVACLMADRLSSLFDVIKLPPDRTIAQPVASHPDMIISQIGDSLIVPESYIDAYPDIIGNIADSCGLRLIKSIAPRSAEYPHDVSLNAAIGKDFVICRRKTCAPELLSAAEELGYSIVNVKQGYSGCSCIVTPEAVITSDPGICSALGDNAVFVPNNGISLPGYDVGFIGGCGGFCSGTLYFFGDIMSCAAGDSIAGFARKHDYRIVCLSNDPLTDYGGIKFIAKK